MMTTSWRDSSRSTAWKCTIRSSLGMRPSRRRNRSRASIAGSGGSGIDDGSRVPSPWAAVRFPPSRERTHSIRYGAGEALERWEAFGFLSTMHLLGAVPAPEARVSAARFAPPRWFARCRRRCGRLTRTSPRRARGAGKCPRPASGGRIVKNLRGQIRPPSSSRSPGPG